MKVNKNQKQYNDIFISLLEEMYKIRNEELSSTCDKVRNSNKQELIEKLSEIMFKYNISDSFLNLSKIDILKLSKEINSMLDEMYKSEYTTEKECIENILGQSAKDSYYLNGFVTSIGISYTLKPVNNKVLKEIIKHKIDGKLWSERLWTDKRKLKADMKKEVHRFLTGQTDVNSIGKILEKKYGNNKYITGRLLNTEICRVQTQASEVWAKKHNIKYQLFMATLDNKTSEKCRSKDGKVYRIDDSNKPTPPLHPHCRSCLVNIVDKDWRPSERYDNQKRERIKWTDFENWQKENKIE